MNKVSRGYYVDLLSHMGFQVRLGGVEGFVLEGSGLQVYVAAA